jgi:hypothetical protein
MIYNHINISHTCNTPYYSVGDFSTYVIISNFTRNSSISLTSCRLMARSKTNQNVTELSVFDSNEAKREC